MGQTEDERARQATNGPSGTAALPRSTTPLFDAAVERADDLTDLAVDLFKGVLHGTHKEARKAKREARRVAHYALNETRKIVDSL